MDKERVNNVVKQMTLEEKTALTNVGADLFTPAIPRLKVPAMKLPREFFWYVTDSFPSAAAIGHTFDFALASELAKLRSREAVVAGESFGGAVSVGVSRKPFERSASRAFSEEPVYVTQMARAYASGSCLKCIGTFPTGVTRHNRYIGERALGEIYLRPFTETKDILGGVAVCGSIGGVPCAESRPLMRALTSFDGLVFTLAGGVVDKAEEVSSGACLDIMATSEDTLRLTRAVGSGLLYERKLDACVARTVLAAAECYNAYKSVRAPAVSTREKEAIFRRTLEESAVLLKNDGVLPLSMGGKNAVICLKAGRVSKAAGRAEKLVRGCDTATVFIEDADRAAVADITALTERIAAICPLVLVLASSCYFPLPYMESAAAVVYLPFSLGEKTLEILKPMLCGESDFSGRLAFSWAKSADDYPYAALGFTREGYCGESVYVGSRYFGIADTGLLFPFGHGLSYSTREIISFEVTGEGELEARFEARADREVETVVLLSVAHEDGTAFGVDGQHIGFMRAVLSPDTKAYSLKATPPKVYDLDKKRLVPLKGKFKFTLEVGGASATFERTLDGEEPKSLSRERLPSYYPDESGRINIDPHEAETLTGALPKGGDDFRDAQEEKRADKVLAKALKRLDKSASIPYVLEQLPYGAKVKIARVLKGTKGR